MISIIIPVHNAEKYLKRCVDSVILSLGKIKGEILLINNASTDQSVKIARQCQKAHPKLIHIFQCSAWGAAAARNFGMKKAKGDYIWFIDADDYIAGAAIGKITTLANKTHADLIMFGAERIYQDGHSDYLSPVSSDDPDYKSRFVRYGMGAWQVLIRRKWWQKNGYKFKEGIIHEDMELMSALILKTNRLASINEPLYYYVQNPNSVLHKQTFSPHIFDIFPALEGLYKRFDDAGEVLHFYAELEWFFIWNLLLDSANDFAKFSDGKPGFKRSRQILKQYFPTWRRNKFLLQKSPRLQVKTRLNYYR